MNMLSVISKWFISLLAAFSLSSINQTTTVNIPNTNREATQSATSMSPSLAAQALAPSIVLKAKQITSQIDNRIVEEKRNVTNYQAQHDKLLAQSIALANKLNSEIAQEFASTRGTPSNVKSDLVLLDNLSSQIQIVNKQLVSAEYRLAEWEAAKRGDFDFAYRLQQQQQQYLLVEGIKDSTGQIIKNQKDISNKLDLLKRQVDDLIINE